MKTGTVEFHPKKAKMLGLPAENFRHFEDFTVLLHPEDYAGAMEAMRLLMTGKSKVYETEYRIRAKDGSYKWFYDIGGFADADSMKPSRIVGFVMDIGKRKAAERELLNTNEELKTSMHEKDKLMSVISHDLRGSLANISEISVMLSDTNNLIDEKLRHELYEMLYILSSSGLLLTENLLNWGRNTGNNRRLNQEMVNLDEVTEECLVLLRGAMLLKSIYVQKEIDQKTKIFGDREQLKAVLRNLISNALKYTPKGGKISIRGKESDQGTTILISDTGIGMDEYIAANLFADDRKILRQGTEGEQTTGLGMKIVKDVLDRHEGTIKVTSAPGEGSTFEIFLPKK